MDLRVCNEAHLGAADATTLDTSITCHVQQDWQQTAENPVVVDDVRADLKNGGWSWVARPVQLQSKVGRLASVNAERGGMPESAAHCAE